MYLRRLNFYLPIVIFSGQPETQLTTFLQNLNRMNATFRKTLSITASAVILAISMGSAFGQAARVSSDRPSFDDLLSPEISAGKNKSFKPKSWLEIETKLKVSMSPAPPSATCDRLTVKWYVAIKNPERSGTLLLLTKDIDHVNVPLEEDVYASVYLSPASLKRITGSDRGGKNAVEYVGYEILINGQKVAEGTSKGRPGWWAVASPKISRSDAVPLLNKAESAFSNLWWDRYAEVSVERR